MARLLPLTVLVVVAGCSSHRISARDLDQVERPAFISRIEDGAGPRSRVFGDGAYSEKLGRLSSREADRRLQAKLANGMSRFEISDRLRAMTLAQLPRGEPWTSTLDPARVASVFESFLVEEVPANPPDYELLEPLGVDAVVELVVEEYGMKSSGGKGYAYVEGYGRMFMLSSGSELWSRSFDLEQRDLELPPLDPFAVAQDPEPYRRAVSSLLERAAAQFAQDLTPRSRLRSAPGPEAAPERSEGARQSDPGDLAPGELPPPDPPEGR